MAEQYKIDPRLNTRGQKDVPVPHERRRVLIIRMMVQQSDPYAIGVGRVHVLAVESNDASLLHLSAQTNQFGALSVIDAASGSNFPGSKVARQELIKKPVRD